MTANYDVSRGGPATDVTPFQPGNVTAKSNAPAAPQGPAAGDLGFVIPPPVHLTPTRAGALAAGLLMALAGMFVLRWLPARHARQALEEETRGAGAAVRRVQIVTPTVVASDRSLSLPGSMVPLEEAVLYPRSSGYVKRWVVDLGDKVREGDLLAEIDTPDVDQQLAQARAQVAQANAALHQVKANAQFSKANLARYEQLLPAGLASKQDFDKQKAQAEVDEASVAVAVANTASQRANTQLLTQLKAFGRIVAPFSGTITARMVERGMLVAAGTATPLFRLSALDPVRVLVHAPQDVAPSVRVGLAASVTVREFSGQTFVGKVERAAGALDPATRTMLTELRVPNPKGDLLTGMYAQVAFTLPTPHRVLSVPATTLLNDAGGLHVAVVTGGNRIHLATVVVERDTGATLEIASGLEPGDRLVNSPSADLTEGLAVEIAR